jgi:hypothetical protein
MKPHVCDGRMERELIGLTFSDERIDASFIRLKMEVIHFDQFESIIFLMLLVQRVNNMAPAFKAMPLRL